MDAVSTFDSVVKPSFNVVVRTGFVVKSAIVHKMKIYEMNIMETAIQEQLFSVKCIPTGCVEFIHCCIVTPLGLFSG